MSKNKRIFFAITGIVVTVCIGVCIFYRNSGKVNEENVHSFITPVPTNASNKDTVIATPTIKTDTIPSLIPTIAENVEVHTEPKSQEVLKEEVQKLADETNNAYLTFVTGTVYDDTVQPDISAADLSSIQFESEKNAIKSVLKECQDVSTFKIYAFYCGFDRWDGITKETYVFSIDDTYYTTTLFPDNPQYSKVMCLNPPEGNTELPSAKENAINIIQEAKDDFNGEQSYVEQFTEFNALQ